MKLASYVLLGALSTVLVFIVGVRYGQQVEKTNEKVSYVLSITPSPSPTETPLGFKTYKNTFCALQFVYPESLKVQKETTSSALFTKGDIRQIEFSCQATTSATLKNKKLNPVNGKTIYFETDKSLSTLFEDSLKFTSQN